jgi:hypothetical protein
VDLVNVECPCDAVAGVNPDFVRKKRQGLISHGIPLSSYSCLPLGQYDLWKDQESKREHPADARKSMRTESIHLISLSMQCFQSMFLQKGICYRTLSFSGGFIVLGLTRMHQSRARSSTSSEGTTRPCQISQETVTRLGAAEKC